MKTSILLSAATLAAGALTYTPTSPNTSQASMWAGIDFTAGLTVGLYIPILGYARDGDCFS